MTPSLFHPKYIILFFISLLLGLSLVVHTRSFAEVTGQLARDSKANEFQEIQILRDTTSNLRKEVSDLENSLAETKDKTQALEALEKEISRNQLLDGSIPVKGPGIQLIMPEGTEMVWLIDLTNELFSIGAEAVSINGVRLLNRTMGFNEISKDRVVLNGTPIQGPYIFKTIGEPVVLENVLLQPGGFLRRFRQFHGGETVNIERLESVEMEAVAF